jgi:hypothetical protein
MLDALLTKHGHEENPLLVGLLHEARAVVADRVDDRGAAAAHRAQMQTRFRATGNPSLIALCERSTPRTDGSALLGADSGVGETRSTGGFASDDPSTRVSMVDDSSRSRSAEKELELLAESLTRRTRVKSAFVYVRTRQDLQLAWSSNDAEPPAECVQELGRWIDVLRENLRTHRTGGEGDTSVFETSITSYRLIALQSPAERVIVGGLVLEAEPRLDLVGYGSLFESLGGVLENYGFDSYGFRTA